MDKLDTMLVVILAIDLIMFFGQLAMLEVNPDAPVLYNYDGSRLSEFDKGNYTTLDVNDALADMPEAATSVSTEEDSSGNWLTDGFKTVKEWVSGGASAVGSGAKYIFSILGGPTTYLSSLNLPREFVFAIGALWYALTIFLFVAFMLGR